jgi:hypothetical protein
MVCRMQTSQLKSFGSWLDDNVARIVRWATFFGLVAAFMSWVASHIMPIYQYGWGAAVFAGVGFACIVTLVISSALVAWRYFNPLPEQPVASREKSQEAPPADLLLNRFAETERGIAQNTVGLEHLRINFEQLEARAQSYRDEASRCYHILKMAIRARDAESKLKEADQIIMCTYKKLLEGPYPDEAAWARDYAVWETAVKRIDGIMSEWAPNYEPIFSGAGLAERAPLPPAQSNIKSDANATRWEMFWLTQGKYSNRRDNIFIFFTSKTGELLTEVFHDHTS